MECEQFRRITKKWVCIFDLNLDKLRLKIGFCVMSDDCRVKIYLRISELVCRIKICIIEIEEKCFNLYMFVSIKLNVQYVA